MSSPTGTWSTTSFLVGICLSLDISTILHSARLWSKAHHSFYYLWLGIIASAHACDLMFRSLGEAARLTGNVDPKTGYPEKSPLTVGTLWITVVSLVFAWIGGCGFVLLNMARFHFLASARMRLSKKLLLAMAAVSALGCTANNGVYIVSYFREHNRGEASAQALVSTMDTMFSVWAIYDGVTNLCISIAFIMLLYRLTAPGDSTYSVLISRLLNRVIWILAIECTGVIVANLIVLLAPAFDPLWNGVYLAESIRLRLFCMFLDMLSRILRKHVQQQQLPGAAPVQHELQPVPGRQLASSTANEDAVTRHGKRPTSSSTFASIRTEATDAATTAISMKEPPQLPPRMWPAQSPPAPHGHLRPR